jgi:predicted 3-demethylubiquinone-9 3-methyltransferase (glyoxalase superfamily)
MQKITPFLWFDNQAEEAANFYVSVFKDSCVDAVIHHGDAGPGPKGTVLLVTFRLEGQPFYALNGGPLYHFTEAFSLYVSCETQQEVDTLWDKLTADGGAPIQCGWLKDKYGLCWQIIPKVFQEMMQDKDPAKTQRVMTAMMQMVKFDIAALQKAYDG